MFKRQQHILHLGRHQATIIKREGPRLVMLSEGSLEDVELATPEGLSTKLLEIVQPVPGHNHWTLLLDSCWLPITTFSAADQAWAPHELKALACHRWTTLYGHADVTWSAQSTYLPGDATATAFGMSSRVKTQLQSFSKDVGGKTVSIQPSLLWAFDFFSRTKQARRLRQGWLWCEQDRCVTAFGQHGHIQVHAPALDKRTPDDGFESTLPFDTADQVDMFVVAGLNSSLTLMDSAISSLHQKPLRICDLLAQSEQEAAP